MESTEKKVRINKYDNLKGLAIFLIVLGHLCFFDFIGISKLISFIYIIHLPIFFFVSGYFSKIGINEPVKLFKRLIIPYLIFTIIYYIYFLQWGIATNIPFLVPTYALWFLLVIFFMKLLLPIFDKFRYPILMALIIAILFGFINLKLDFLGFKRFFVFLPIYLIGFYYNDYKQKVLENYRKIYDFLENKIILILISIVVLSFSIYIAFTVPFELITMKYPYTNHYLYNMLARFSIIAIGIISTLILNRIMIDKECFLTKWGRNSMTVYLLHIFVTKFLEKNAMNWFDNGLIALIFAFLLATLIVYIFSRDIFTKYLNLLTDEVANLVLDKKE